MSTTTSSSMPVFRYAYVGTYGKPNGEGKGIYVFQIENGEWTLIQTLFTSNPSFLCFNSARSRLYAANEIVADPEVEGTVTAYEVDPETRRLHCVSSVGTGGTWPCHLCLDKKEKYVFAANYKSGSIAVFPINSDGSLKARCDLLRFSGLSKNKVRQEGPHSHYVNFYTATESEESTPLQVVDLGLDRVFLYNFDETKGTLENRPIVWWTVPAGAGPRHIVVHKEILYVINELNSTISVFLYDIENPSRSVQNISTLPVGWKGTSACAELMLHPNGKFLYASNRGHDSIAIFKIDEHNEGNLSLVGHESTKGKIPRHFQIDEDLLYVGNQDSNSIAIFKMDSKTGKLTDTGRMIEVPSPVCIVFS